MARYEQYGVIDGMRERYIAIAVEIADALTVLAKATAGAPQRARQAALMAIAQIAAVQEKLSRETQRLPASREEQLALMQGVLQAQQGALLHLAEILRQLGGPAVGRIAGARYPPQLPLRLPPPARYMSSAELGRALMVSHRGYAADRGASERPQRRARRADINLPARSRRSSFRRISLVLKVITSRSLVLVTIVASGLLVAYGTFPRAGYRWPGTESTERSGTGRRITPPPVPGGATARSVSPHRPLPPPTSRYAADAEAPPPAALSPPTSARTIGESPAGISITGSIPQPPLFTPGEAAAERREEAIGTVAPPQETRARLTTAAMAPPASSPARGFVAVVFTHKDPATARRAFADLQGHFPNVLHRRQGELQTLDMGEKGVWYRLAVVPPGPREQAEIICRDLAAGGYDRCWVMAY